MADDVVNINGRMYDWSMVKVSIAGTLSPNCSGVNYTDDQDMAPVYAGGKYPVGYSMGQIKCDGSITLKKEDVVALERSAPNGRIQEIAPFDIVVTFLHPDTNKITSDVLKYCKFKTLPNDWKTGDMSPDITIPLMIMRIKPNVTNN